MITVKQVEKYPQCQMCMGTENVFEVRADGRSMSLTLCVNCSEVIASAIRSYPKEKCSECGDMVMVEDMVKGVCMHCANTMASDAWQS